VFVVEFKPHGACAEATRVVHSFTVWTPEVGGGTVSYQYFFIHGFQTPTNRGSITGKAGEIPGALGGLFEYLLADFNSHIEDLRWVDPVKKRSLTMPNGNQGPTAGGPFL